jgi:RHS repeat-associated protein
VLQDGNYNVTALADAAGAVFERYRYTPYGERKVLEPNFTDDGDNISDVGNPYTYTGRQLDSETGLYYYRARYYHAQLGRFVSRDPIGYIDSQDLYIYVRSSPLASTDPFGLKHKPHDPKDGPPRNPIPGSSDPYYNCHCDAWHAGNPDPAPGPEGRRPTFPRWDDCPKDDYPSAKLVPNHEPNKIGDIVVYHKDFDGDKIWDQDEIKHSGTVIEVDEDGNIIWIRSKEGENEIFIHHPEHANPQYSHDPENPVIEIYRPKQPMVGPKPSISIPDDFVVDEVYPERKSPTKKPK